MNESGFVASREPDWKRLQQLCDYAENGFGQLKDEELKEFVRVYRRASSDLSFVRSQSTNLALTHFLNDLVVRAYSIIYTEPRKQFVNAVRDVSYNMVDTVRRRKAFVFAAVGIFVVGAIAGSSLVQYSPTLNALIVPPELKETFEFWKQGVFPPRTSSENVSMTAFYGPHNALVSIVSGAAAAATFGLLTIQLIVANGMMLGALMREMASVGHLPFLVSSLLPHGIPEMSGLFIAGAGGLIMGWAMIHPGRKSRAEALGEAGRDAVTLLLTAVILTFIAAPIEGLFSFNRGITQETKAIVAFVEAILWYLFWTKYGKNSVGAKKDEG